MAITILQRWSHLGGRCLSVSPEYDGKKQCVLYVSTAVFVVTLFALSFSFPSESTLYYHNAVNEAYAEPYVERSSDNDVPVRSDISPASSPLNSERP